MATDENSWRTQTFRQSMVAKIEEAIQTSGIVQTKTSTEMENHVFLKAKTREEYLGFVARLILHVKEMSNAQNAKKNHMVSSGGMQDPIGALQNLARQGTGNNQMMGMGTGQNPQSMMQQASQNTATNLLQSLNRPNQSMGLSGMQNKMAMPMIGQTANSMSHMSNLQNLQANQMMSQINQMGQSNLMPNQLNQMAGGQMQQNLLNQMQSQLQNQLTNQMVSNVQSGMTPSLNQISGNLNASQMSQHMQRKIDLANCGFMGSRNVAPNQFIRQSPSPSVPSPGLGSNQMVPSPALVPSPSAQQILLANQQRSIGMVPSPSSSLNTPAGPGATPSPQQEDQAYKDKVRQLSKYTEPLRKMIAKMSSEGKTADLEKLSKMNTFLGVLSHPTAKIPMETLLKCEAALENFAKRGDSSVSVPVPTTKENHFYNPLLEAVSATLQSPIANHTLHRTFRPCMEALFGPEIKNLPAPLKRKKVEDPINEISDVLQGEIARLDQRFKVSIDTIQQTGAKCINLTCWLDDRHLPCVPPICVTVPTDYPHSPPRCVLSEREHATPFLSTVRQTLNMMIAKLPKHYSVSRLLDTWEMSVRQASTPAKLQISSTQVLMGVEI